MAGLYSVISTGVTKTIFKDDGAFSYTPVCQQSPPAVVAWSFCWNTPPHATDRSILYRTPVYIEGTLPFCGPVSLQVSDSRDMGRDGAVREKGGGVEVLRRSVGYLVELQREAVEKAGSEDVLVFSPSKNK